MKHSYDESGKIGSINGNIGIDPPSATQYL